MRSMRFTTGEKKLLGIYIVLGVVLLAAILSISLYRNLTTRSQGKPSILEIEAIQNIGAISLDDPGSPSGDSLALRRTGADQWQVRYPEGGWYDSRSQRVRDFLESLGQLAGKTLVTSSQDSYAAYDLDEASARVITLRLDTDSPPVRVLYYGKYTPGGNGVFVRTDADPRVFTTGSEADFYINQDLAYWTELRLWPQGMTAQNVYQVEIQIPGQDDRILTHAAEGWEISTEQDPFGGSLESYVSGLTTLELSSLDTGDLGAQDLGDAPMLQITMSLQSGTRRTLEVYTLEDDTYYAIWKEGDQILLRGNLPSWRVTQLLPGE